MRRRVIGGDECMQQSWPFPAITIAARLDGEKYEGASANTELLHHLGRGCGMEVYIRRERCGRAAWLLRQMR